MTQKCNYPGCHQAATKSWALVPLCPTHFYEVHDETQRYYNGRGEMKVTQDERKNYFAIAHLTPWKGKR
jgi:hypothetical protein